MISATNSLCALSCNCAKISPHFSAALLFRCVARQHSLVKLLLLLCNGKDAAYFVLNLKVTDDAGESLCVHA